MTQSQLSRTLTPLAFVAAMATGAGALLHETSTAGPAPAVRESARELSRAFRDVARNISPSVVGVTAIHEVADMPSTRRLDPHQDLPEPFRRFFGGDERFGQLPFQMPMPFQMPDGQGTGVIVDANGIIATNNHVVAGASRFEVTLQDGRKLDAKVVGTDPETDLALLRVDEKGLPAAKLGDSQLLEPGDWVVAVGNPYGLDHTVTVGVVSATGRSNLGVANYEDFIQTDAAINPGNSGGPLVNLDGEVVGINTAIRTTNGGSDGISFAIPSATLANVLPDLVSDGRVSRGWLGVNLQPLTDELARSFDAKGRKGALVSQVLDDTPAADAGLRPGDIVLTIDGQAVRSPREASAAIAALDPGSDAELGILRDGEETTLHVALGERPGKDTLAKRGRETESATHGFGLRLTEVPEAMAKQQDLDGGALIREVEPGSAADDAGLRAGDVILSIGKHEVDSAAEASDLLRSADSGVRLLVRSQDESARWVFLEANARD